VQFLINDYTKLYKYGIICQKGGFIMLKSKNELENFLEGKCIKIALNNDLISKTRDYIFNKYNIPKGIIMDMITQRVSLIEKTEFELFCLLDGIDNVVNTNNKEKYFTDIEIKTYLNEKLEVDGINFPLDIKCYQVSTDQWIGASDVDFFIKLRKAQLIKYNVNAQRVMKRIIKGATVLFKIVPNKLAIKSIKALMKSGRYIPTTITLNIPYDLDAEFYYDEKEGKLVIKKLDIFDISDGYHRYLAVCELYDEDQNFNYPMEIRIVNFTDEKTRQFIFQEDQKTKMTKADSNTMNMNRPSNNAIDRLNEMSGFDLKGQIGRNTGLISYTDFSNVIEYFYFKEKKLYSNTEIRNAANDIKVKLNSLIEYNEKYISKPLNIRELSLIFYVFSVEENVEKACSIIDEIIKSEKLKDIKQSIIAKPMINAFKELI